MGGRGSVGLGGWQPVRMACHKVFALEAQLVSRLSFLGLEARFGTECRLSLGDLCIYSVRLNSQKSPSRSKETVSLIFGESVGGTLLGLSDQWSTDRK